MATYENYPEQNPVLSETSSSQQSQSALLTHRAAMNEPLPEAPGTIDPGEDAEIAKVTETPYDPDDHGCRRIIRNFVPS
jgi:hypothetical protein